MSNEKRDRLIQKELKKSYCVIHINRRGYRKCESCGLIYCKEDIVESWSTNFLSYAFMGQKKDFKKEYLCKSCERSKRRKSVFFATFLLIVIGTLIISFAFTF